MERRGNRSALCMKRGTQDPPNWNPHILRRWLSMTNTSTFRARRNEYECTHVGRCNRTAYTIYSVNVQSSFDRRIERFARFRTSSDYRINFERVFLYFLLYLFFPLFFNKNDDHPIDHAPDRGTFFIRNNQKIMGVTELVIAVLTVCIGAYLLTGKRRRFIYLLYKTLPRDVL